MESNTDTFSLSAHQWKYLLFQTIKSFESTSTVPKNDIVCDMWKWFRNLKARAKPVAFYRPSCQQWRPVSTAILKYTQITVKYILIP